MKPAPPPQTRSVGAEQNGGVVRGELSVVSIHTVTYDGTSKSVTDWTATTLDLDIDIDIDIDISRWPPTLNVEKPKEMSIV